MASIGKTRFPPNARVQLTTRGKVVFDGVAETMEVLSAKPEKKTKPAPKAEKIELQEPGKPGESNAKEQ